VYILTHCFYKNFEIRYVLRLSYIQLVSTKLQYLGTLEVRVKNKKINQMVENLEFNLHISWLKIFEIHVMVKRPLRFSHRLQ